MQNQKKKKKGKWFRKLCKSTIRSDKYSFIFRLFSRTHIYKHRCSLYRAVNVFCDPKVKLKNFITRIILEKFKKRSNLNEKFSEQKDKFFSEVYAYICDEIKLGMDEYVQNKKEDIHDHILSSYESSRKELIAYEIRKNKEPEEKRLLRLSKEYENLDDLDMAMKYYKNRITLMQNKEIWNKFSILSKKMGNLIQTEQGIMRCLKIVEENEKKNLAEKKKYFSAKNRNN